MSNIERDETVIRTALELQQKLKEMELLLQTLVENLTIRDFKTYSRALTKDETVEIYKAYSE